MVTQELPYLPDIIRDVVTKVNTVTTNYPIVDDRFTVGFNHGLLEQVGKDIYQENKPDVLVWLPMTFEHDRGRDFTAFGETNISLLIGCKTDNKYTQVQRDEISFKPKLIPVYSELMKGLEQSKEIVFLPPYQRRHTMRYNPYWGGGDVQGQDTKNLWKEYIDAIVIRNLELKLRKYKNCP